MAETDIVKDTAITDTQNDDQNGDNKSENIEVHSANAWEKADLGDDDRKNKFLRLMGAGKKEHHGRFVIGDHNPDHARKNDETQKLQHELEDQYTHSMQHRMASGRRGHVGLGYHEDDQDAKAPDAAKEDDSSSKGDDSCEVKRGGTEGDEDEKRDSGDTEVKDKPNRKRESTGNGEEEDVPVEKKMKMVEPSS